MLSCCTAHCELDLIYCIDIKVFYYTCHAESYHHFYAFYQWCFYVCVCNATAFSDYTLTRISTQSTQTELEPEK